MPSLAPVTPLPSVQTGAQTRVLKIGDDQTQADILTVKPRNIKVSDRGYVVSTWVKSLAASRQIDDIAWEKRYRTRVNALLDRGALVRVLCDPEDEELILAWGCRENNLLHYLFTREAFRRQGLATQLIADLNFGSSKTIWTTHWSWEANKIVDKSKRLRNLFMKVLP